MYTSHSLTGWGSVTNPGIETGTRGPATNTNNEGERDGGRMSHYCWVVRASGTLGYEALGNTKQLFVKFEHLFFIGFCL